MIQFDEHMFHMGWFNRQLVYLSNLLKIVYRPTLKRGHFKRQWIIFQASILGAECFQMIYCTCLLTEKIGGAMIHFDIFRMAIYPAKN